jgi:hypothetical protein
MFAQYTVLIFLVSGKSLAFRSRLSPGRVAGLGVPQHVWQRQRAGATGRWRRAGVAGMIAESRPEQGAPHTSTRPDRLFGTQGRDCRNAVGNQQADQHQDLAVQASNWCKARAARHARSLRSLLVHVCHGCTSGGFHVTLTLMFHQVCPLFLRSRSVSVRAVSARCRAMNSSSSQRHRRRATHRFRDGRIEGLSGSRVSVDTSR